MPCLETIIRNMYLKEDHMSGKTVIVMGKKGVVANKTGSDGITSDDEIYNIRFEDGSISTHPVRDMQMIGESVEAEEDKAEEDKKVTCPKCDGEGCEHCDDKGYHLESVELDEGTPAYRKAMAAYKNSDTKKVFDILKKKGFRGGPQGDVLVRNMLKKNKGNIQKAAAEIEKKYPNLFKESVELDEAFDMKKMLKIFNKLRKNDTIKIKYDSSIRKGKEFQTFVVTSPKRPVGKKGVERVIMKHVDNPTGVKYTLYNRDGSVSLAIGDMAASMTDIRESVVLHSLDEALVLASDNLNIVKKTAEKLAKQSPDLTYYVVKHNERYMKGMKYAYYEVYQSVDMHLIRGKAKKVAGYGAKVDMRESVEELDEMQPHGMFGSFGGQKKKSTRPSRPTRIAVDKEFARVNRSGKMDTMAAKKHLEKKFKITDVRIEKDKNGKPHVTYFQESVEPTDSSNSVTKAYLKRASTKRRLTKAELEQARKESAYAAAERARRAAAGPVKVNSVTKAYLKNTTSESVELDEADRPMQFPGAMSGGKMKGKFTSAQLKQLKDAYAKIGRIDPSSKAYEKLTAFLDAQDKNVLQQLANARIQFISSLALNRVNRLKMKGS